MQNSTNTGVIQIADHQKQLDFARDFMQLTIDYFISRLIMSDEAHFYLTGHELRNRIVDIVVVTSAELPTSNRRTVREYNSVICNLTPNILRKVMENVARTMMVDI